MSACQPRWKSRASVPRLAFAVLLAWVAGSAFGAWLEPDKSPARKSAEPNPWGATEAGQRIREGTAFTSQTGTFRLTGDRLTFYPNAGQHSLGGLENLNLERIARAVAESAEPLEWSVSGIVTEYQGGNYLLVTRAVLKSRHQGSVSP
jgi:hypothetical protein